MKFWPIPNTTPQADNEHIYILRKKNDKALRCLTNKVL